MAPAQPSFVPPAVQAVAAPPTVPSPTAHAHGLMPATQTLAAQTMTGVLPPTAQTLPATVPGGDGDPEKYSPGTEVNIGSYRFRCSGVLGRGSFSEVWSGEVVNRPTERREVALKDIFCQTPVDLQQALFEASLLERFQGLAAKGPNGQPTMRIPQYLAHRVDQRNGGWRMRLAMTRVPGESLDAYLRRAPPRADDGPTAVRRGAAMASRLIRQLGPTLERIAPHAWHRDVNSHNVLISDIDGGKPRLSESSNLEQDARRANFWLIDFGLAVDSTTWPSVWPHSDVAGDCRYWPPSSFVMSFYGPEEMANRQDLCNQYKTKLDVVGLALTALEVLCSTALASSHTWGPEVLRGSWRRLFAAWQKYREEVTRWHTMIFQVFSSGGDIGPLYQTLGQEHVVDKVAAHVEKVRGLLRACMQRTEDTAIQRLLGVLAEMLDERSRMGLREAVEGLGPEAPPLAPQPPPLQPASYTPPPQQSVARVASYTPPSTISYTPPPTMAMARVASYTPPSTIAASAMAAKPVARVSAPVRCAQAVDSPASDPGRLSRWHHPKVATPQQNPARHLPRHVPGAPVAVRCEPMEKVKHVRARAQLAGA